MALFRGANVNNLVQVTNRRSSGDGSAMRAMKWRMISETPGSNELPVVVGDGNAATSEGRAAGPGVTPQTPAQPSFPMAMLKHLEIVIVPHTARGRYAYCSEPGKPFSTTKMCMHKDCTVHLHDGCWGRWQRECLRHQNDWTSCSGPLPSIA